MTTLYRDESYDPKTNAQRNLMGRTHYVDPDTLRFHHSRILSAQAIGKGLTFAIVESVAADINNAKRGFRYVLFDLFGTVIGARSSVDSLYSSRKTATKAMWADLNGLDEVALALEACDRVEDAFIQECRRAREDIKKTTSAAA